MNASTLFSLLASLATLATAASTADCLFANQFLCQTQCGKVLIQCTGAGAGAVLPPLDEDAAVCNAGKIDFAANCAVQQPLTNGVAQAQAAQAAQAAGRVALGAVCSAGQYACGPRDTAANQDTIAVCQGGVFVTSANCDEGAGICQLINAVPYCL
ncbi:hypothetical protein BDR26DRAFT_896199 [Obelidium mucronatum]|nr:hypothetical protein BDR26DRAFT_896199 [Obelidium mucronatum]